MVTALNGRVTRLEQALKPADVANLCRACGLRHVQPMTLDLARRLIGRVSWASIDLQREVAEHPAPRLCLCEPCCGDPRDRTLARMSHGLDDIGAT